MKARKLISAEYAELARSNRYPFYVLRLFLGLPAPAWFRLLARNRFLVSPSRIPYALLVSVGAIINSVLNFIQRLIFGKRIAATNIDRRPVFIIGHWRTGTTYLHELLSLDERFITPTTRECFAPGHFLVSGWLLQVLGLFLPSTRPMDNVLVGWERPQEDEFALVNSGVGSPYDTIAFPNRRPARHEYFSLRGLSDTQVEAWKAGLLKFLRQVTFYRHRDHKKDNAALRFVLKSPPHTARIGLLRQLFPDAQFIHIVRNPFDVFSSTVRFWHVMYDNHGFQKPRCGKRSHGGPMIEDYVFDTMNLLYDEFLAQVAEIPAGHFCEVRYEDLNRAPISEMRRIYCELELGSFEPMRQKLETYLVKSGAYQRNEYGTSEEHKANVRQRWAWYLRRYKYPD
jgi:hypothetical protein